MLVKSFCWSCGKESDKFKNKSNGEMSKYCKQCYKDYSTEERKLNEYKFIMNIMNPLMKDIDIPEE